ncbi:LuxR C-terminal-related transcriptional regulator [Streptomyces griseosporeus]|uniref:LuxR C-terminal-related transcriptional regulator n=1 Tax=Streptomyces griseosporeus TaxID=1910 RepID=UPI0036BFF4CF
MSSGAHTHGAEDLCEAGAEHYARALREGRVPSDCLTQAPCLQALGLLHPDPEDPAWLRPVAPRVALTRHLRRISQDIDRHREREARLVDLFEPFLALDGDTTKDPLANTVLTGMDQINARIEEITATCREALIVQPGRRPAGIMRLLPRDLALVQRGGRLRTLYQHTQRHSLPVIAYYEHLVGDVEVRTLDEVTKRLMIFDRTVAFIPASADRTVALEIRHPALVDFLVTAFERLWQFATPMYPRAAQQPAAHGITPRQRAIARLLVEGHTDAVIADRLGMNIRTARVHIAKLAATLGSESRAQLGYLIAESGILKQDGGDGP